MLTERQARELLVEELEKRSPDGRFWIPAGQTPLFDTVSEAAIAAIMRASAPATV